MAVSRTSRRGGRPGPVQGRFRIIGGAWRGRRFPVPDAPGVRPTPDRVRETLFNWLAPLIEGARCLDLYAGSGALGLEALSRGAGRVVFVDRSQPVCEAIRQALATLGVTGSEVVRRDAGEYLEDLSEPFDVVFLDPPFRQGLVSGALERLAGGGWLAPGGRVYIEQERQAGPLALPDGWEVLRHATAGQVGYHLARPEPPPDGDD